MADADGTEPIEDDERLYRRLPIHPKYFDPAVDPAPTPFAFRPREEDDTGLSVSRAKYKTVEDVAANPRGKQYYVAILEAGELRRRGIRVVPKPLDGDPGHAELPDLRYDNRTTAEAEEMQVALATELCRVDGPYPRDV